MVGAFINATDLLHVFDIILGADNSTLTVLDTPFAIFGSRKPALPYFIWWYFLGISALSRNDAGADARAVAGLQSLLCLTMYHCQAKNFADLQRGLRYVNNSVIETIINNTFPPIRADTAILPATQRHIIVVGLDSLIAYVVMSGSTWLICFFILLSGTTSSRVKDTTYFPTLDFVVNTGVQPGHGPLVLQGQFPDLNSPKNQVRAAEKMTVKPATQ